MGMKIIMDSGKEYNNEIDNTLESFFKRAVARSSSDNYVSIDEAKKITISVRHISSFEFD